MGVAAIPGAMGGQGNSLHVWSYSNKSAVMRFGSLVALSNLPSAGQYDILVWAETKAPATTPAMKLIGVCSLAGPEDTLTNPLEPDDTGVTATPVSSGLGRHPFILSPNSTVTVTNPYLVPDSTTPGNVAPWTPGCGLAPVARALNFPASSASEQYIEGEFLPGSLGMDVFPGDFRMGDATDAVVNARFIPMSGLHINPATPQETPVLYVSTGRNWISALSARVATAPGGGAGDGVRYEFRVGATPQAANAAAMSSAVDILGANTIGTLVSGQPAGFWMTDGQVLVVKTVAQGGGVGAALHSIVTFRAQ